MGMAWVPMIYSLGRQRRDDPGSLVSQPGLMSTRPHWETFSQKTRYIIFEEGWHHKLASGYWTPCMYTHTHTIHAHTQAKEKWKKGKNAWMLSSAIIILSDKAVKLGENRVNPKPDTTCGPHPGCHTQMTKTPEQLPCCSGMSYLYFT